jgi:hypothetical protein
MWRAGVWLALAGCIDNGFGKVEEKPTGDQGELVADPEIVDFGVRSSGEPVSQVVVFTSVGEVPVTVSALDLTGSGAWSVTWASEETTLDPGASLEAVVTYTPASFDDPAQLIARNDGIEPSVIVPLLGAGTYPAILVEPSAVHFTSEYGEPVDEEVLVTSVGTTDLVISSMLVEGVWFSAEGEIPITLAPGESTTLSVQYVPEVEGETAAGKIWLTTNTTLGYAMVPLDATWGLPCIGQGEAWDRGLLDGNTLFDALTLEVSDLSTEEEICVDRWYVWLSDDSQDLGAGDMDADFGDVYPYGSVTIAPEGTTTYGAAATSGNAWWCMEQTQTTDRSKSYEFIGAYVPEPLLSYMLAADQDAVWDWMANNPVMIAARETNYIEVPMAGGSEEVTLRVLNMGGRQGTAEVRESVPAGWTATDFSEPPLRTEEGREGATVYVWEVSLDERIETDTSSPTIYADETVTYTLTVPPCRGRQWVDEMYTSWEDSDATTRIAYANPLVVKCVE